MSNLQVYTIEEEIAELNRILLDLQYSQQVYNQCTEPEVAILYKERFEESYEEYREQCVLLWNRLEAWLKLTTARGEPIDLNFFRTLRELRKVAPELQDV